MTRDPPDFSFVLGGTVAVPFLLDVEVHVKFLLAMPLLIGAKLVVHRRLRHVVRQFLERRLIPEHALGQFQAAVQSAFRLRNSVLAEVVRSMRIVPVTKEAIFQVALATLAPILPLALTMMPLEELLKKLFGILL